MAQEYFRFEQDRVLGLISSSNCNTVYASKGRYAVTGALETVYIWNIRTGQMVQHWMDSNNTAEVVIIAASPADENVFAAGYSDGSVRVWNLKDGSLSLVFHGHKACITALSFDANGTKIASGARDNEIIVWDLISEAGLFRMRGHSNAITGLAFCASGSALISTSKDTLVKVWDLITQHCVETIVIHHAEITALSISQDRGHIITVGADTKMRLFTVNEAQVTVKLTQGAEDNLFVLDLVETVNRSSADRANWLTFSRDGRFLAVMGAEKSLEMWKFRTLEEFEKTKNKKSPSWFKQIRYTRLQSKARSIEFTPEWKVKTTASLKLLVGFTDNQLGEVVIPLDATGELSIPTVLDSLGHRSDCKAVTFNSEGSLFATSSKNDVKVWNPETGAMIRTIEIEEPTVLAFLTDDRGLLVADNAGHVHLIDLVTGEAIDSSKAHEGAIRAMTIRPDNKGMMTGGSDKNIKFWEFKSSKNEMGIRMKMIKTLQLNDEITGLMYSPDLRYIAAATMDLTIKVFFEDSLRFYLSLYGHKLPVTGMDISADSKVLISCSADKNIKIWSLEFGECRKSIFGHTDAVTGISFIPGTRQFITCSKDKTIKYWDAEKFVELQKLTGHLGEIWALGINKNGSVLVTVSKDRSVRLWRMGEEMLFPEEEREREMEEQFERSMVEENPHEREENDEKGRASTKTLSSMKAGERIMECLEAADIERRKWDEYHAGREQGLSMEEPTPEAFFLALGKDKTPAEFLLAAFERIPLPDIEEALLCLPTNSLSSLLFYIKEWLEGGRNIVMSARILDMTLRLFHRPIIANPGLRGLLESIRDLERQTLIQLKDILGYNNIAMQMMPSPPSSNVLGVFGLSHYTRERDLEDIFSKYGVIKEAKLVMDRRSNQSRGFGFIYFEAIEAAEKAMKETNGMRLDGRYIRVDFSETKRPHSPTPGKYMGERHDDKRDFDKRGDRYGGGRDRDYDRRRRYRSRSRSPRRRSRSPPRGRYERDARPYRRDSRSRSR